MEKSIYLVPRQQLEAAYGMQNLHAEDDGMIPVPRRFPLDQGHQFVYHGGRIQPGGQGGG